MLDVRRGCVPYFARSRPRHRPPPPVADRSLPLPSPSRLDVRALLPYAALFGLAMVWGVSFLLVKLGLESMRPTTLVFIRAASAAVTLVLVTVCSRRRLVPPTVRRRLPDLCVMAILYSIIPWSAIGVGELTVSSGMASILNVTAPLWTALFAFLVTPTERPGKLTVAGLALGLAGTVILVVPSLVGGGSGSVVGALALLVGAMSTAAAYIYQRRRLIGVPPLRIAVWQMIFASAIMAVVAAPTLGADRPTALSLAAVLALGVVSTGVTLVLLYRLLNVLGSTRTASVNFLLPVTAVIWGATLLGERVTPPMLIGMGVILLGIVLTGLRLRRPRTAAPDDSIGHP